MPAQFDAAIIGTGQAGPSLAARFEAHLHRRRPLRLRGTQPVRAHLAVEVIEPQLPRMAVQRHATEAVAEGQFVEVVIAPGFTAAAHAAFARKPNVRLLAAPVPGTEPGFDLKRVSGGVLLQTADTARIARADCRVVTRRTPTEAEWADLNSSG